MKTDAEILALIREELKRPAITFQGVELRFGYTEAEAVAIYRRAAAEGAKSEPFEHAGLKIRPSRVKEGDQVVDRWVVQSPENAEREARGERQIGGDRIVETREQAIKTADQEAKRYAKEKADRAEMDAREKAERDAAEARREANKGKTLTEIKADGYMAQEVKDGKTGDVLTRAEWVKRLVDGGAKLSVEMVNKIKPMSRAAFNRATNQEQAAHEKKVKAAGQVPEYSIGDFIVTKTEYDFAQKLVSSALTAPTKQEVLDQQQRAKDGEAAELANLAGKMIGSAKVQVEYYVLRKESPRINFLEATPCLDRLGSAE